MLVMVNGVMVNEPIMNILELSKFGSWAVRCVLKDWHNKLKLVYINISNVSSVRPSFVATSRRGVLPSEFCAPKF